MGEKGTILIVEDSPTQRMYLHKELEESGFDVLPAASAEDALVLIQKKDPEPDVALLDIMLPGMNGFELCHKVKSDEATRNIGVIFMTDQFKKEEQIVAGLKVGGDDYIIKPYNMPELVARVEVQLRIRRLQKELVASEKLGTLVQLAGAAAHEINQPLSVVLCNIEFVIGKAKGKIDEDLLDALNDISEAAKKVADIIEKIKGIKRLETTEYTKDVHIIDIHRSSQDTGGAT